jgi:DnaK suppressor protein
MERNEAVQLLTHERERLERALDDVRDELAADAASYDENEADIGPPADRANGLAGKELDHELQVHFSHELIEIQAAIERVDAGTYGRCERCGEPIPDERLRAIPWARTCIADS